jgi:hypothetical protein
MVPLSDWDPELRELVAADQRTPLELGLLRVHAHRPSHAKAIVGLHAALWTDRLLSDRLLELVRLRIAFFTSVGRAWRQTSVTPSVPRSATASCSRPSTSRSTIRSMRAP